MLRLFISSVQKEFASERAALRDFVAAGASVAAQPESRPESLEVRVPGDRIERCRRAWLTAKGRAVLAALQPKENA